MLNYMIRYKFSILLAILIALLSLLPADSFPDTTLFSVQFLDKLVHLCMYAAFGFVSLLESRCYRGCIRFHLLLILIIFLISALIEVLQATVVATRSAEWFDLLANLSGLLTGYVVFRIFIKTRIFNYFKS